MQRQAMDYKYQATRYIKILTELSDIFASKDPYHFGGHGRDAGGAGFEFNIKVRKHINVPEGISDEQFMDQMGQDLEWFMSDLKERYDWIKEVGTTGRSGGWMVVIPKSASPEEVEDTIKVMEEVADGTANYSPSDELDDAKKVIQKLTKIQDDLSVIENEIKNTADDMFKEYEKKEFWEEKNGSLKQAAAPSDAKRAFEEEIFPRLIQPIIEQAKKDILNAMIPIGEGKWPTKDIEYAVNRHREMKKPQEQFREDILDAFGDWSDTIKW